MFDQLADYSIPVLHPVVVHLPVALSVVALLTVGIWLFRNADAWWRVTFLLQSLSLIGTFAAVRTGEIMQEQSEGVAMVDQFVELHETMGERALWLLGLSLVMLLLSRWMGVRETDHAGIRLRWRFLGFIAVLAAVSFVVLTAHIGGLMTWGVPA
ncbi:MAG: DUF2231 domain-containing protein [Rhodothermales bacterium]